MLTGLVPFDSENPQEILNGHVFGKVTPPKDRNPRVTVDEGTNSTIMRCLRKSPKERYQTMDELLIGLADCFTDQVFLRDANRMPGAVESGIRVPTAPVPQPDLPRPDAAPEPKARSITDELGSLFLPDEKTTQKNLVTERSKREQKSAKKRLPPLPPPRDGQPGAVAIESVEEDVPVEHLLSNGVDKERDTRQGQGDQQRRPGTPPVPGDDKPRR
jgi:serine/threonine protein kinase